ncbi:hypothetical protein BC628DRAFT_1363483 [Trametes gibbosa]|uniref:C2H2-type domain-containing protein n=1 Tax=Trametes gibbosa TaxID=160864 RepID=A0A6G6FQJ8_9APHY|nr:hypothetical protein BC628DRAFT_1363483 [Trametes gibbosa]QIE48514.1 hypothetical protein [Trametes gibbosa]
MLNPCIDNQFCDDSFMFDWTSIPPGEHSLANSASPSGLYTVQLSTLTNYGQEEPHGGTLPQQIPAEPSFSQLPYQTHSQPIYQLINQLPNQPPYQLPSPPLSQPPYVNNQPSPFMHNHAPGGLAPQISTEIPQRISHQGPSMGPQRFICFICQQSFTRKWNMKQHIEGVHMSCKYHQCLFPGCGKEYARKNELQGHYEGTGHGPSRPERCPLCDKRYSSVGALSKHMGHAHSQ